MTGLLPFVAIRYERSVRREVPPAVYVTFPRGMGSVVLWEGWLKRFQSGFMGTSSTATASLVSLVPRSTAFRCGPPSPAG